MAKRSSAGTLLEIFESMEQSGQERLVEYARFLGARHKKQTGRVITERQNIARPEEETVIASIKRLRATYPMLDTDKLLHATSSFMMQHMMHGRPARDVIDDLEIHFKAEYEVFIRKSESDVSGA